MTDTNVFFSGSARDLHRPFDGQLSWVAIKDEVLLRGARSYPYRNHRYETDDGQQPNGVDAVLI